jgi:cyclophilin family peptidyl-prolyl cis-trans isomerase
MPPKRRANKAQAAQSEKSIQAVATIVILVVMGAFVWSQVPKKETAQESACGIFDSITAANQYETPPPMLIDKTAKYLAHLEMEKGGEIVLELYPSRAPLTVNSFIFLACKGFYDGVTFHRVLDEFMAQTGDPTGTGLGGPGYHFKNEDSDLLFDKEGVLAMANSGRDTNGSQFFITFAPNDSLNGSYTIFGRVIDGMDVVNGLVRRDPQESPSFEGARINTITITLEK